MKHAPLIILASLILTAGCTNKSVTYPTGTELPVSRVVMYQSGIGYVERTAKVSGDELVLRIRPDQINDILKSLTVIDRGDGRPVSISLPVDKTTLDSLAQIPSQVKSGGIRSLLQAFRGANVKIKTRGSSYEGRIVGVDIPKTERELNITVNDNGKNEDAATVTLMTKDDVLEVIALTDIKSVALYDKSLSDGLDKSLNISLNEGDWKLIELRIRMDSKKERELAMSYLVAMPTWKPAYRLVLADEKSGTLQGWAVISNVTGADWNNISFSLVSGQPMSFTYDLYTPQFLTRPDLSGLAAQRAAAPEIITSGYGNTNNALNLKVNGGMAKAAAPAAAYQTSRKASKSKASAAKESAMMMDMAYDRYDEADEMEEEGYDDVYEEPAPVITSSEMMNSFTELAEKAQIGSFDEYKLASKLTVPDGNTALVNLVQNQLTARDTRLIKADDVYSFDNFHKGWKNSKSFQTIELANSSDVALDSGPITIYRDSAIIGEGYLSRTEVNATAYITFANENRLSVSVSDSSWDRKQRLDSFQNGRCAFTTEETLTQKFNFESQIPNDTIALLQLRRYSDWTPVDFPDNVVKSSDKYVVSVTVPGKNTFELPLSMKRELTYSNRISMDRNGNYNIGDCGLAIKRALEDNQIPADQVDLFKQYMDDVEALSTVNTKIQSLQQRRNEINTDQSSISNTLAGLKDIKTSNADALRNQLMNRQKTNEKALVDITTELYGLQVEKSEIDLRLQSSIKALNYIRK